MSESQEDTDRWITEQVAEERIRGRRRASMHDWVSLSLLVIIGIMLASVVVLVAFSIFEPAPLVYRNLPLPVDGPVHAGEPVPLHIDRCNNLDTPLYLESARTMRNVATGQFYSLPSGDALAQPGCSTATVTSSIVPEDAPPGIYVLNAVVRTYGRWGRRFDVPYRSEPFEVIKEQGDARVRD